MPLLSHGHLYYRKCDSFLPDSADGRSRSLLLRLSIFIVMFMWTFDKFVRPDHVASVFANYYSVGGLPVPWR